MDGSSSAFPVPDHALVTEFHFADKTDERAEPLECRVNQLHPSEPRREISANLVAAEDPLTGAGLVWLRLAPSAAVRTWDREPNLVVVFDQGKWAGRPGSTLHPYEQVILPYSGGPVGRTRALQAWQRNRSPVRPGLDGLFVSNTWGDFSKAGRMSEAFVLEEIDRAAELGVEVVQLDDGWQQGRSANTVYSGGVWNGFWAADPYYWDPDPVRFPRGLEPICARAASRGIKLGLWYAPDSTETCANWERDAARIVELWRRYGVGHFKLDAVKLTSPLCAERFLALLERVEIATQRSVLIDLDTTAEARLGYWGKVERTAIFVENRFTDWANYFPHSTLRAIWSLAQVVHPTRLRFELLNPERNDAGYGSDPLRPSRYPRDYLFASLLATSPLGWFENSGLSPGFVAAVSPLVALWKRYRHELQGTDVLPIGEAPTGASWPGFAFVGENGRVGHLVLFRESTRGDCGCFRLPDGLDWRGTWRWVAGTGRADFAERHMLVSLAEPRSYCWLRNEAE